MYYYILLYLLLSKCVGSLATKGGFVRPPQILPRDSSIKPKRHGTLVPKPRYYNKDGTTILLPATARPRRRVVNILEESSKIEFEPVETILKKVKDQTTFKHFETIKSLFLQISKWMSFRKQEILDHQLFNELRLQVLSNLPLFGAVYSRHLQRLLKSSTVYSGFGIRNPLKYYIRIRDGMFLESFSLQDMVEFDIESSEIPETFFQRLSNLCINNDTIEVLKSVFKHSRIRSNSVTFDMTTSKSMPIHSNFGYFAFYTLKNHKTSQRECINEICKPESTGRFEYLKTGETDLEFANRHYRTVLNLFIQVYKLSNFLKKSLVEDEDLGPKQKINVIDNNTTGEELVAIYYMTEFALAKREKLEHFVATLCEIVDYLNKEVQNKSGNPRQLYLFIQHICPKYMEKIKGFFRHFGDKLETIYDETFSDTPRIYKLRVTNRIKDLFEKFGLENLKKLFQSDEEEKKEEWRDQVYGLMRDSSSTFLYNFNKERIVTSSHPESMDTKNFKGNQLEGVTFCHIVINSKLKDANRVIEDNLCNIREKYLNKIGLKNLDTLVTLDLPNFYQNPPQPYDKDQLKPGKVLTHPVNSQLYMTAYDWE